MYVVPAHLAGAVARWRVGALPTVRLGFGRTAVSGYYYHAVRHACGAAEGVRLVDLPINVSREREEDPGDGLRGVRHKRPLLRDWECKRCGRKLGELVGQGSVCREGCTAVVRCRHCKTDNSLEEAE